MNQQPVNATSEARELLIAQVDEFAVERIRAGRLSVVIPASEALAAIQAALSLRDDAYRAGGEAMREAMRTAWYDGWAHRGANEFPDEDEVPLNPAEHWPHSETYRALPPITSEEARYTTTDNRRNPVAVERVPLIGVAPPTNQQPGNNEREARELLCDEYEKVGMSDAVYYTEADRGLPYSDHTRPALAAIQAALALRDQSKADVVEACARVAETRHKTWKMPHPDDAVRGEVCCDVTACEDIAAAIRSLSPPVSPERGELAAPSTQERRS